MKISGVMITTISNRAGIRKGDPVFAGCNNILKKNLSRNRVFFSITRVLFSKTLYKKDPFFKNKQGSLLKIKKNQDPSKRRFQFKKK